MLEKDLKLAVEEYLQYQQNLGLKKLMLIIEQSFKLLDTLGFCLKDKAMFFIWQGYKVTRTVIIRYAIQMVNNPTRRQWFIINLLPYKNMLPNIFVLVCSWMVRVVNFNITALLDYPSPFPSSGMKDKTTLETISLVGRSKFATINTIIGMIRHPSFMCSICPAFPAFVLLASRVRTMLFTTLRFKQYRFSAYGTRFLFFVLLIIQTPIFFYLHSKIISLRRELVN